MTGVAFMTKADVTDPSRLRDASDVGDRNADDSIDCPDIVEFECFDNQAASICEFRCSIDTRDYARC
ncbi:hypothetical protein BH09ACT8_BH09ACT8_11900 [soil metagenome]